MVIIVLRSERYRHSKECKGEMEGKDAEIINTGMNKFLKDRILLGKMG